MEALKTLFKKHLKEQSGRLEAYLEELDLPGLVLFSGDSPYFFEDDIAIPFKVNHHFRYWCPAQGEAHCLILPKGKGPVLLAYQPQDYWHAIAVVGEGEYWSDSFEIKPCGKKEDIWSYLKVHAKGYAAHGPCGVDYQDLNLVSMPRVLWHRLNWLRSHKSEFEVKCSQLATEIAARGHKAARDAFYEGLTELGIYQRYLMAMDMVENELPYNAIIAINEQASVLHNYVKRNDVTHGNVFLIDAGAQYNDYASDISRTYASEKADETFKSILASLDKAQQSLVAAVSPGYSHKTLHLDSQLAIAKILKDHKVITDMSVEAVIETGLCRAFYPHGVGHFLGIHVHDVGGKQINPDGDSDDAKIPNLRATRTYAEGNYITVEPGIYFIEMLLKDVHGGKYSRHINWTLVEKLKPCGGIRIEDNVLVTAEGSRNLTREIFSQWEL